MACKLTEDFVFEYFSQLNPIANKIQAEINQAIENYEHLWQDLDKKEQMTIINEAIIKPEIQLNYHKSKEDGQPEYPYHDIDKFLLNYFRPRADIDPPPFSYKTRSQEKLFYSFNPGDEDSALNTLVRMPVSKAKNQPMTKSTDSLNCVNFVNLNVKAKKGRAPGIPTKMTTKPPPPPPPKKSVESPVKTIAVPIEVPEIVQVLEEIPRIPEDNNSSTSLLSPADELDQDVIGSSLVITETSDSNDDEFKSLLETGKGFDFLQNW